MNSMPEMKYAPQLTPRSDYHSHNKLSAAKPKFDSIVKDEHSKAVNNRLRRSDIHSENTMKQDDRLKTDRPACNQCSTDVENRLKKIRQDQDRQSTEDVETRNRDTEDSEIKTDSERELKIKALLVNLINNYMADVENGSQPVSINGEISEADNVNSGESGTETNYKSGLKVGALLNELISKYAAGEAGAETNSENGLKVGALLNELISKYAAGEAGAETNSENGLKVGVLLNELISKYVAGETGTETNYKSGLKVGALLNELINKYAAEIKGDPNLNSINDKNAELIDVESGEEGKDLSSKNGLKLGHFLNRLFTSSDSDDKAIKVKAESNDSKIDNPVFKKEMPVQAELRDEALKQINNVQSKEAVDLNAQEKNAGAEGLRNNLMSGFSDQFNHGNSPGNGSFNFVKSSHNFGNNSAANNINLLNSTNTASDAAGAIKHTFSVNDAKTPAFRELLDNIVYVIKDNNRMGVTVEHDNFGKLNINLSMDKGMVNVHINTSDNVVREFLQNNIQHIVDSLNKDGVSVGDFSIALKDKRDNEGDHFSSNNGQVKEDLQETRNEYRGSGLVNIFA